MIVIILVTEIYISAMVVVVVVDRPSSPISLVDSSSKISAHFGGMFCRLLSISCARIYSLFMQSLKNFANIYFFITKSIENKFSSVCLTRLQRVHSCHSGRISQSILALFCRKWDRLSPFSTLPQPMPHDSVLTHTAC